MTPRRQSRLGWLVVLLGVAAYLLFLTWCDASTPVPR